MGQINHAVEKKAYRRKEFLKVFGIGKSIYYAEIRSGRLKSLKVGRARLVTAQAATEWLELLSNQTPIENTNNPTSRRLSTPRKIRKRV